MYFGVGRSGKGYSSLSLSLSLSLSHSLSLSLTLSLSTHIHTVLERENFKFLTIVVRKCVEICFSMKIKMMDRSVNAN